MAVEIELLEFQCNRDKREERMHYAAEIQAYRAQAREYGLKLRVRHWHSFHYLMAVNPRNLRFGHNLLGKLWFWRL